MAKHAEEDLSAVGLRQESAVRSVTTYYSKWNVYCYDSQPFRSRANSLPGANRPIELWPIRSLELSLPRRFVPWPIRSWLSRSLELCSQERNGPGTFVPLVDDVDTRYSNYMLLMQTFWIERCSAYGLSQTLIRRPCSG